MKKKGMSNPQRFWTGVGMLSAEFALIGAVYLASLSWAWVTSKVLIAALVGVLALLYNGFTGMMIWFGSRDKE